MDPLIARLYSAPGDYVATVEIPPFETGFPPAILWGARFFMRLGGPDCNGYFEVFCYVARVEVLDREDPRLEGPA